MKKRLLSAFLAICMMLTLVPAVFAAGEDTGYTITVEAEDILCVGKEYDATATLKGTTGAASYDRVRFLITVTNPSKANIMATDSYGVQYNLAEVGAWGPEGGFTIDATTENTTPLKISFEEAGSYTATFQLVDVTADNDVIAEGSKTVTVEDAYSLSAQKNGTEPILAGQRYENAVSATLRSAADADALSDALLKFELTEQPEGSTAHIWATDTYGNEYDIADIGFWGSSTGFPVAAGYEATTEFSVQFDKAGTYKAYFKLISVSNPDVPLAEGELVVTVADAAATPVAQIGETTYLTLQDAVNAVKNGQTIEFLDDCGEATVGRTVRFKVSKNGHSGSFKAASGYQMFVNGDEYIFVSKGGLLGGGLVLSGADTLTQRFVDVRPMDYYFDAVNWAYENGITSGTGKLTFSPDESCTRAQAVTFLWRAMGCPSAEKAAAFTDVKADHYYAGAVAWAVENGITNGTSATTFSPDAPCTRAQIVTLLYRAIGVESTVDAGFADVPATAYYADAVDWAAQYKITGGTGANCFSPDAPCTRAQIVTFLYRAK